MATDDLTRSAFYGGKKYRSVRMQQGRVLTDDDYNEGQRIAEDDRRRTRLDTIGPCGSPDQGFAVVHPGPVHGQVDFGIHSGTFYLGGLRLELEEDETFRLQGDWLLHPDEPLDGVRTDLVYLEAWHQPVSAVEDEELFEAALGGPDTTTRHRAMARVHLKTDVTGDCVEAWQELLDEWATQRKGALDESHELVPDTRLTVRLADGGEAEDLCTPQVAGGYLGAENQAIRVRLLDADHFTWGFDNGAPLYRVQVATDDTTVTLLSEPKDSAHWPQAGMIVEVLPWSAVLVNGEKLAEELAPGHLSRVETSYDPDTDQLTLSTPLPEDFGGAWQDREDEDGLCYTRFGLQGPDEPFFFLRVWDRGADRDSDPEIPLTPAPVSLGATGLEITVDGADRRAGDYWIIAVRPETPDRVVPWQLLVGHPPHGVRRFYAPLALIHWAAGGSATVHDCRKTFRPLTELGGCCTVTVGDGHTSHGDFDRIQDAVDSLPATGGEVCVGPGTYEENVVLDGRYAVTLRGCGRRSLLRAPDGTSDPALLIRDSSSITVRSLAVEAFEEVAIRLEQTAGGGKTIPLEHILLADLDVAARDRAALLGQGGQHITLRDSRIVVTTLAVSLGDDPEVGRQPAVFLAAQDLLIEGNRIEALLGTPLSHTAAGGLQIGGGSERVEIRRNRILGGTGTGILLGSVSYATAPVDWLRHYSVHSPGPLAAGYITIDEFGCLHLEPFPGSSRSDEGEPLVPASDGDLRELRIIDNEITKMGGNGIGVALFFDLKTDPDFITTDRLTIEDNHIHRCLGLRFSPLPEDRAGSAAFGGIILADGEYIVIRRNTIEDNGISHLFPVCGIYILHGEGIAIDGNRILHNGPRIFGERLPLFPGIRGGIRIGMALPRTRMLGGSGLRQDGVPAVLVHNNEVVAPEGRALGILGLGPMSVEGNRLTSQGGQSLMRTVTFGNTTMEPGDVNLRTAAAMSPARTHLLINPLRAYLRLFGGAVVAIVNLGISNELYLQYLGLSGLGQIDADDLDGEENGGKERLFIGGNVLFNDNQVVLDALGEAFTLALSSVLLVSLDDISMSANQLDCDLLRDFVVTHLLALGFSLRVTDNRFKEGLFNAYYSAVTSGLLNHTINNQGTHCFLFWPRVRQQSANSSLRACSQ